METKLFCDAVFMNRYLLEDGEPYNLLFLVVLFPKIHAVDLESRSFYLGLFYTFALRSLLQLEPE